jgi:tetratricopeptide (TPR) repeat protein
VLDDDVRCGVALLRLAQVARVSGRYDDALGHLDQGLRVLRLAGAHRFIADVMDEIGLVQLVRGQEGAYKLALAHFLKALALRRRSEDRRLVARSLVHIAKIHSARGHDEDARDAAKEAVDISERIQDRWGAARARAVLGEALAAAGRYRQALTTWAVAADLADEIGDAARKLELAVLRAEAYIALGDWEDAAALMVDTLDLAEEVKDPELLSGVYRVQSAISLEREALETADLDSLRAVEVAEQSGARLQVARANIVRGCVLGTRALSETGADSTVIDRQATRSFEAGLRALREMGDLVRQAEGLRSFSSYLEARGGGPRLASAKARLEEIEREMAGVSGV